MRQTYQPSAAAEANSDDPTQAREILKPARRPLILECLLVGIFAASVLLQVFVLLPGQQEVLKAHQELREKEANRQYEEIERLKQIKDLQQRIITNNARIIAVQERLLRKEK